MAANKAQTTETASIELTEEKAPMIRDSIARQHVETTEDDEMTISSANDIFAFMIEGPVDAGWLVVRTYSRPLTQAQLDDAYQEIKAARLAKTAAKCEEAHDHVTRAYAAIGAVNPLPTDATAFCTGRHPIWTSYCTLI